MAKKISSESLFLIDGSALLYRSYYGLRPLRTATGVPTQAIYGFCRAIKKIIDDYKPHQIVVLWDSKGKTVRHEEFEEYKATRQPPPSDLFEQKEYITKILDKVDLQQIAKSGYEADDIIGDMVHANKKDKLVVIVGPDKDLYQLLDDNVVVLDPIKREIIDSKSFTEKRGFAPEKLLFYHSLVGDSSDNIPGVKGIGKVSAEKLVQQFETLDDLYKNLDSIEKNRIRNALAQNKDNAYLSQELFKLRKTGIKVRQKDLEFDIANWVNAADIFKELEFTSMLRGIKLPEPKISADPVQQSIFDTSPATKEPVDERIAESKGPVGRLSFSWKCIIVQSQEALDELIALIKKKKFFAFDTETTGLRPLQDHVIGISFALDEQSAYYIPFTHVSDEQELEQLDRKKTLRALKPLFESSTIKKVAHNAKFDALALAHYDIMVNNIVFDTILAANILRKEWDRVSLKKVSKQYLDQEMDTFKHVVAPYKKFERVPLEKAARYAAHDALQTFKLMPLLEKELAKEPKLKKLFTSIDMPCSKVLFEMERTGIHLDEAVLAAAATQVKRQLTILVGKIEAAINYKRRGEEDGINLNSPKQVEILLFDELELPVVKKSGKGKRSTDHEVLVKLSQLHPIPGMILKYRELFKLFSTYLEPLPKEINPETGCVHTTYSQTLVITGRLSSSQPNLQNIPATQGYGTKVREAFHSRHGYTFLSADYSQIELRVLAYLSKDTTLKEVFENDEDIHTQTAAQLFSVEPDAVTTEQRQIGKRINFSIMYGMTPYGLAKDLGIKPAQAKEYIDTYFARYQGVAKWMDGVVQQAKKDGYVSTWMGRRRYVSGINERNQALFLAAKRAAVNTPVQGTQADLMKKAMIELHDQFETSKVDACMILQIHDEVLIEVKTSELDKVEKLVRKTLENVVDWPIPLKVTLRSGQNWADVTK